MSENTAKNMAIENIITTAIQIPGVKVDRKTFLSEWFAKENVDLNSVVEFGPVEAGCTKEIIYKISEKLVFNRTSKSSIASFVAGIPGGIAMAATVPADVLQFFGMSLRMAQEISYLYGSPDLWKDGEVDDEMVRQQLILYTGVMFGVSGAVAGVRFLTTRMTKQALKKIPQKALTKTLWYPFIKKIAKIIGITVTKKSLASGVSKIIPVIGGVVSGAINFASMMPMGKKLVKALEQANFDYTEEDANADLETIIEISEEEFKDIDETEEDTTEKSGITLEDEKKEESKFSFDSFKKVRGNITKTTGNITSGVTSFFKNKKKKEVKGNSESDDIVAKLENLQNLKTLD